MKDETEKEGEECAKTQPRCPNRPPLLRSYTDPTDLLYVFRSRGEPKSIEGHSPQSAEEDKTEVHVEVTHDADDNLCEQKSESVKVCNKLMWTFQMPL